MVSGVVSAALGFEVGLKVGFGSGEHVIPGIATLELASGAMPDWMSGAAAAEESPVSQKSEKEK